MKIKIIKLTIFFFFFTSVSHSQNLELTDSGFNLPSLIYQNSRNNNINSDVDGIVSKIIKNKDDKYLVFIKTKTSYFYKNNLSVENYDLIYGNIEKVYIKENDKINYGTAIGLCEPECFVTSSFEKLSPFPIRLSQRKAIKFDNYYFFTPDWINKYNTNFLSFRSISSLQNFLNDYFNRWKDENDDPSDFTVFHTNSIDRIRFQINLSEYPKEILRTEGLFHTEHQIYSTPDLFFTESIITKYKIQGYSPVIFWQKNYDTYLKEEYKLNSPLFVYASVTTIDHINKRIYICARDFTQSDDEKVVNDRLNQYQNP
ncbi:hypothetical protein [Leptospira levettii]|uniref:hypothetical protein n=1 Tax=Leptospira levettii TaxID=2023178 RepID=UPI000C2983F1|nr:hypothetical protein [Leptospira levettii]PKA22642.1 hypothetical protein CH381_29870 [Leptospira sp. mixed culture ATI2-C-A1]TGM30027.1 hypothetical protein EHQ74_00755 [Leptospira levettii]TGM85088.1 hypothetical protein EHR00_05140 [Leptospira levettii]